LKPSEEGTSLVDESRFRANVSAASLKLAGYAWAGYAWSGSTQNDSALT